MEPFWTSLALVTVAEMGDKTQLLSFVLAARFRGQYAAIIAGIFVATIVNHALAAWLGGWVSGQFSEDVMRWVIGGAFLAFAGWALIPDTLSDTGTSPRRFGAFMTTAALFFIAEMGDKTQLATVGLSAQYLNPVLVTVGSTLGMMVANIPAVILGERLSERFPLQHMRFVAAALFAIFGVLVITGLNLGLDP